MNEIFRLRKCKRVSERVAVLLRIRVVSETRVPPPSVPFASLLYVRPSVGLSSKHGMILEVISGWSAGKSGWMQCGRRRGFDMGERWA